MTSVDGVDYYCIDRRAGLNGLDSFDRLGYSTGPGVDGYGYVTVEPGGQG